MKAESTKGKWRQSEDSPQNYNIVFIRNTDKEDANSWKKLLYYILFIEQIKEIKFIVTGSYLNS